MFPSVESDCEIGYAILQKYAGHGYMSSAARCAIDFLKFLIKNKVYNISRLRATAKVDNGASNRIIEKLKFCKSDKLVNDRYEYFYDLNSND